MELIVTFLEVEDLSVIVQVCFLWRELVFTDPYRETAILKYNLRRTGQLLDVSHYPGLSKEVWSSAKSTQLCGCFSTSIGKHQADSSPGIQRHVQSHGHQKATCQSETSHYSAGRHRGCLSKLRSRPRVPHAEKKRFRDRPGLSFISKFVPSLLPPVRPGSQRRSCVSVY